MGIDAASLAFLLALLGGMILLAEAGAAQVRKSGEATKGGLFESFLFILLGLLLTCAFADASARLKDKSSLVIQEANALSTAALRLSLLADPTFSRASLKDYIQTRLVYGSKLGTSSLHDSWIAGQASQSDLWKTVLLSIDPEDKQSPAALVLPPLNDAFNYANKRQAINQVHLPWPLEGTLILLALFCSWVTGRLHPESKTSQRITRFSLAFACSLILFMIKNLDSPQLQLIQSAESARQMNETMNSLIEIQESLQQP